MRAIRLRTEYLNDPVGIDVRNPDFWRSSLAVIRQDIDEFCALAE